MDPYVGRGGTAGGTWDGGYGGSDRGYGSRSSGRRRRSGTAGRNTRPFNAAPFFDANRDYRRGSANDRSGGPIIEELPFNEVGFPVGGGDHAHNGRVVITEVSSSDSDEGHLVDSRRTGTTNTTATGVLLIPAGGSSAGDSDREAMVAPVSTDTLSRVADGDGASSNSGSSSAPEPSWFERQVSWVAGAVGLGSLMTSSEKTTPSESAFASLYGVELANAINEGRVLLKDALNPGENQGELYGFCKRLGSEGCERLTYVALSGFCKDASAERYMLGYLLQKFPNIEILVLDKAERTDAPGDLTAQLVSLVTTGN